jgi:hypothetical protein
LFITAEIFYGKNHEKAADQTNGPPPKISKGAGLSFLRKRSRQGGEDGDASAARDEYSMG